MHQHNDVNWVTRKLYKEINPKKTNDPHDYLFKIIQKEDDKRRAAKSEKTLYQWCRAGIKKAKYKKGFYKVAMLFLYPFMVVGQLLIYISQIIKALGFILMFDFRSAKFELSDWSIEF